VPSEHQKPPLTNDEQAQILKLAARLQAEEAAGETVAGLARAASEAGIEARFVEEASRRLSVVPSDEGSGLDRQIAIGLIASLVFLNLLMAVSPLRSVLLHSATPFGLFALAVASGAWVAKAKLNSWWPVVSLLLVWCVTSALYVAAYPRGGDGSETGRGMIMGLQVAFSFAATLFTLGMQNLRTSRC
jgi:hypothetical protein